MGRGGLVYRAPAQPVAGIEVDQQRRGDHAPLLVAVAAVLFREARDDAVPTQREQLHVGHVDDQARLRPAGTGVLCPVSTLGIVSDDRSRPARVEDVHELAVAMPHVTVEYGTGDNPVYQVGRKSFIFFRNPRPDAVDRDTGERYQDVIVFWVGSEADKQALVQDEALPFFTTSHFDGHPSVLLRASRIGDLTREELAEIVQDAWLSRASARRAATWLSAHPPA